MFYRATIAILLLLAVAGCHSTYDDDYYYEHRSSNLLLNSSFEYFDHYGFEDWISDHATYESYDPYAYSGEYYLLGAIDGASSSYTYQMIYIGNRATHIVAGGFLSSTDADSGAIVLKFYNRRGSLIKVIESAEYSPVRWSRVELNVAIPYGATTVEFGFAATRYQGYSIDACFDSAYLYTTQ